MKSIVIVFPEGPSAALTHPVCNLGEYLWRAIEVCGLGDMGGIAAIDRATDRLVIQVKHKRKLGTVQKVVATMLKRHKLEGRAEVSTR